MSRPIKIQILGDSSNFKKAAGDVDSTVGGMESTFKRAAGIFAAAFATDKLVDFGKAMFGQASSFELQGQKIKSVFGDQEAAVRTWADSVNEQFGLTETGVANLAASTADLLKPLGFTSKAAADMSEKVVGLAPALAQWSAGQYDAAQVTEIIQKAMLGETDGLKALGISISAAETEARALTIAQKEGRDEATNMDKALATQQLIFEKSTDAQAAYSGGTDTLAGKQAALKAKFAELKETLASKLMPVFTKVGDWLVQHLPPVLDEIEGGISAFAAAWTAADGDVTSSGFPGLMEKLANFLRLTLLPALQDFGRWLMALWAEHGPKVTAALSALGDAAVEVYNGIRSVIDFLMAHQEILVGIAVAIGVGLVAAFLGWAASAAAAAAATIAATWPIVAIGVAIAALVAGVIYAYEHWGWFKTAVDAVARFMRDTLWPILKSVGAWIRDTLVPIIVSVATKVGEWIGKLWDAQTRITDLVASTISKVADLVRAITDKATAVYDAVTDPFRRAFDWLGSQWDSLKKKLTGGISIPNPLKDVPGIGGLFGGRAYGGPVGQAGVYDVGHGKTERVYLPKGSYVEPAHTVGGGSGQPITVNVSTNARAADIAAAMAWELRTSGR